MNRIMKARPDLYKVDLNWYGEVKMYMRWAHSEEQAMHYATRELGRELNKSAHNVRAYFSDDKNNHVVVNMSEIERVKQQAKIDADSIALAEKRRKEDEDRSASSKLPSEGSDGGSGVTPDTRNAPLVIGETTPE
jgi:hypothetical protein